MIIFETVRWKNLLSTGNSFTEVKLTKSPNTLIVGENGAGKSTILDALCFCLYGKSLRKIKKDQLINSINQRDALVEVEFTSYGRNYKVVRGIKPNVFEIYQNEILLNQTAAVRDYQEILEKNILRMNFKSFTQIVILGRASFVPFMQLRAHERREVIEDLLDIRVFSTMSSLLKDKISNLNQDHMLTENDIKSCKQMLKLQEENIERANRDNEKLIREAKKALRSALDRIKATEQEIDTISNQTKELGELQNKRAEITQKMNEIGNAQKGLQNRKKKTVEVIEFYEHNDTCPTCTQTIDDSIKQKNIAEKSEIIKQIEEALEKLDQKESDLLESSDKFVELISEMLDKVNLIRDKQIQINQDRRECELHKDRIEQLTNKIDTETTDALIEIRTRLSALNVKLESIVKTKSIYDTASIILKDTGIKSRIIKQYIPVINALVNKYLAAMDFFVKFELNENFEEKILSRHRDDFTYDSFSEGEKMRIDLALLFTWRTVARMKNSAATNLLILDEVFDASLDTNGCEEFLKLIHSMENANVFVISHKGDILQDKFRSSIRFEKSHNFSKIAA